MRGILESFKGNISYKHEFYIPPNMGQVFLPGESTPTPAPAARLIRSSASGKLVKTIYPILDPGTGVLETLWERN